MAVGVNIYPPVLDTYMPAFLKDGENVDGTIGYKIYLSLSDYNKFEEVENNVQITLVRQDTNKTALLASAASSGIKITHLNKEEEEGNIKYYVVIGVEDLVTDGLITNLFYKVQMRFTSTTDQEGNVIPQQVNPVEANWYTKYLDCFSEWSTVCLIKGIETPQITLTGMNTSSIYELQKPTLDIIGNFAYAANSKVEKETLKSYQLLLYNEDNELIEDSGEILSNQNNMPNKIAYTFNSFLESSTNYQMKLIYTTINLYTNKNNPLIYDINVQYNTDQTNFIISNVIDNEDGIIQVKITLENEEMFESNVVLRRTSSKNNFEKWETIHTFDKITNKHIFNDMTVESGIIYKYYAYYDRDGYSAPSHVTDGQMICLDFILLTTKEKQLKIYLDGKISSVQYTVAESKTDTIGGKYPVIRKNGNLMYRTLPIEGTIHSYMDDNGRFETRETIYGETKVFYDNYNLEHNVKDLQDYIYEKFFREKVKDFLFIDQAILLRTPSEGNLIVKCLNNSFSPNTQLNNLIYKFTTNAIEIDDCNLDNIKKYSLLKETGDDIEIFKKTVSKSSVLSGDATDIFDSIDRG